MVVVASLGITAQLVKFRQWLCKVYYRCTRPLPVQPGSVVCTQKVWIVVQIESLQGPQMTPAGPASSGRTTNCFNIAELHEIF